MLAETFFNPAEIERSFREFHARKRAVMFKPDGRGEPSLVSLVQNFEALTQAAFACIAAGEYQLGSASVHQIWADKGRTIHHFNWLDTFLLFHLARTLAATVEPLLPPCLFSYRTGKRVRDALLQLQSYVRSDAGATYVLRRDVSNFGEQMDHQLLLEDFKRHTESAALVSFFEQICRFVSAGVPSARGLPGGHHIQLVCENLYLLELDLAVSEQCCGCYLRFGDDILFAAKSVEQARLAKQLIDRVLQERGLSSNREKSADLLVQNPARGFDAAPPGFRSASHFAYLGTEVFWSGELTAPARKFASLRRILKTRVGGACLAIADLPLEQRLEVAIRAVNNLLRQSDLVGGCESIGSFLMQEHCSEPQLRELDRWLELLVIKAAARRGFKKGNFSAYSPRALRQLGLPSLLHLRRTYGR